MDASGISLKYKSVASVTYHRSEQLIHQICLTYRDGTRKQHGRARGASQLHEHVLKMGWGEVLTAIRVKHGTNGLEDVQFCTNQRPCRLDLKGGGWLQQEGEASDPIVDLVCSDLGGLRLAVDGVVRCPASRAIFGNAGTSILNRRQ